MLKNAAWQMAVTPHVPHHAKKYFLVSIWGKMPRFAVNWVLLHPKLAAVITSETQRNAPMVISTQSLHAGQKGRSLSTLLASSRVRRHKMTQVIPLHPTATKTGGWILGSWCLTDTANTALVIVETSVDMIDEIAR
jgi:hypothetical protein